MGSPMCVMCFKNRIKMRWGVEKQELPHGCRRRAEVGGTGAGTGPGGVKAAGNSAPQSIVIVSIG